MLKEYRIQFKGLIRFISILIIISFLFNSVAFAASSNHLQSFFSSKVLSSATMSPTSVFRSKGVRSFDGQKTSIRVINLTKEIQEENAGKLFYSNFKQWFLLIKKNMLAIITSVFIVFLSTLPSFAVKAMYSSEENLEYLEYFYLQ